MDHTLSQVVDEYRKFRETGRVPPTATSELDVVHRVELCTTNGRDWAICLVRQADGAVTPLAFGAQEVALKRYKSIMDQWDPTLWPPVIAVVDGASRVFTPTGMSFLLGVIQVGETALLLGVLKRETQKSGALALLHVNGPRVTVMHVGGPMDLRRVDVDQQLGLQATRLEAQTREAAAALLPAFARLLARCSAPNKRVGPRHRGKGSVHLFIWVLVQLARMGAEDLYGRLGDIEKQIKVYLPGVDLPRETLGDVLALMIDVRTCLVVRVKLMWHIRLSGLNDPESAIHKRFCGEAAKTLVDLDAAARFWVADAPPVRTKLVRQARSAVVAKERGARVPPVAVDLPPAPPAMPAVEVPAMEAPILAAPTGDGIEAPASDPGVSEALAIPMTRAQRDGLVAILSPDPASTEPPVVLQQFLLMVLKGLPIE